MRLDKKWARIVAFSLACAVVLGLAVYTVILHQNNRDLKNQLAAVYQKSFEELLIDITSLETKLRKLEAANGTNQYAVLLMDVWRQTGDTEGSIAALPVSYAGTSALTQFITRTGDYCRMLSRKLAQGQEITKEEFAQVAALAQSCGEVYASLEELFAQGYPGNAGFAADVFIPEEETSGNLDFANQEFPRLQYDGPFSESTESRKPEGLSGSEVTQEEAAAAAAKFLGLDAAALAYSGDCNGRIECYEFSGETEGRPLLISVTKQGGKILWYRSDNGGGISAVPTDAKYEALTEVAQKYLKDKGYGASAPSYAQFYNGMAIINLAPMENEVVLYPDLIKVWVDIAGSKVVGMEANNYLMSHKKRSLGKPELTMEAAKEKLAGGLVVTKTRLALIPLESGEEKLCWEFTGSVSGRDYIVYINAATGMEEDILMIQHTKHGTQVM
jgi:germination protein YpeB